jgi:nucleoside-diphosphate-sugar epimerase
MVIPYALRQAMSGAEAEFSDGLQVRDFVYVDDVADAFCVACSTPGAGFRELNIGTGQGVRIRDVVETIAASLGARQRFRFGVRQRRMNEPDDRIAAVGRAREELGWSARTSWREGIDRVIDSARRGYAWTA